MALRETAREILSLLEGLDIAPYWGVFHYFMLYKNQHLWVLRTKGTRMDTRIGLINLVYGWPHVMSAETSEIKKSY